MLQPLLGSSGFSMIVSIALSRTRNACTALGIVLMMPLLAACQPEVLLSKRAVPHSVHASPYLMHDLSARKFLQDDYQAVMQRGGRRPSTEVAVLPTRQERTYRSRTGARRCEACVQGCGAGKWAP